MDSTPIELSSALAGEGAREGGRAGLTAEAARPQKSSSVRSQAGGREPGSSWRLRRWFSEPKHDEKTKIGSESEAKTEPRRAPNSDVGPNANSCPPSAQVPASNSFSNPITQPSSHTLACQPRHPPLSSPRSFRLLTLQHENRATGFLSFVLRSVDIDACNSFNALSYTWGCPFGETRTKTQPQADPNRPDLQAATTPNPNPNDDREVTDWLVPSHPILCNGHTVLVCPNLFDALSQLHRDGMLEASWFMDYLCIDQSSLSERAQQVALMGEIYASAQQVFCWLGREDEHSMRTVEVHRLLPPVVRNFVQEYMATSPGALLSSQSDMRVDSPQMVARLREQAGLEGEQETPLSMEHWRAYATFCLRRWFRRTWVVQEMCLGRELVLLLGSARLDWSNVATVMLYMYIQPWSEPPFNSFPLKGPENRPLFSMLYWLHQSRSQLIERMDKPRFLMQHYGARSDTERVLAYLLQTIDFHSEFSASDPRDKIYGLLGMANRYIPGVEIDLIKPDYRQTVDDCFVNVAEIFIEHLPWVSSTLSLARPSRSLPGLPSWVPDFAARLNFGYISHLPFLAGIRKEVDLSARRAQGRLLSLHGTFLGTLVHTEREWHTPRDLKVWTQSVVHCIHNLLFKLPERYPLTGESRAQVLMRTLVYDAADRQNEHLGLFRAWLLTVIRITYVLAKKWPQYARDHRTKEEIQQIRENMPELEIPTEEEIQAMPTQGEEYKKLLAGYETWSSKNPGPTNKKFMFTNNLALVVAPELAMVGDQLWIIKDAKVPYLLRAIEGSGRFILVGPSYCHGVMRGEWLETNPGLVWTEITLE